MNRGRSPALPVKRALSMGALVAATLMPARSHAQPSSNEARAETLFNTAKQLEAGGHVADACPLFSESLRLSPGVGVALHLADCYERVGRTASAWQGFRDAERLARDRGDDKRANVAQGRARALELRLERLTLATSAPSHEGWRVILDGAPVAEDRWNAALAMDPGDHTVVVDAPGVPPRILHAHLDPAENAVTLYIDDAPAPAPPPQTTTTTQRPALSPVGVPSMPNTPPPAESSGSDSGRTWAELGLVGLTAAGVGFGSFFMIRRGHFIEEGTTNPPDLADQAATAATISFVVGGVALTSALVLFFTGQGGSKTQTGWVVAPTALDHGAGALVRSTF